MVIGLELWSLVVAADARKDYTHDYCLYRGLKKTESPLLSKLKSIIFVNG